MGILVKSGNGNVLGLLKVVMSGIQYVNNLFYSYYEQEKYEVIFTGQIIYMKRYLNDQFDDVNRGIYIQTNTGDISPFVYRKTEGLSPFVYRVSEGEGELLQRKNEQIADTDFTVFIPTSLSYDSTELNAAIKKYKLEDKTFTITTY